MRNAVILAAGKGTRMHSDLPKVLHKVLEMPMAELIVRNLKEAGAQRIVTVVGYGHELVKKQLEGQCEFALQEPQLGTGHAVMQAQQLKNETGATLVVNGDCPAVQPDTLRRLFEGSEHADMTVLTVTLKDAASYGRVIRDADGNIEKIVEFKDCTKEEAAVHEINTGIYGFQNDKLFAALKELKNDNAQKEYYITDLVEIFRQKGWKVRAVQVSDEGEVQGVNDCLQLAQVNAYLRRKINTKWMKAGIQMINPEAVYIGPYVKIDHDVQIHPDTYLYGDTTVGAGSVILPGAYLKDVTVKENTVVKAGYYENCELF